MSPDGLDPISMIIGALQENVKEIKKDVDAIADMYKELNRKLDKTNEMLTNQRVKVGVLSATISVITGWLYSIFKSGG